MNINVKSPSAKGAFINNKWQPSRSGKTLPMVAPAIGQVFAAIAAGNADESTLPLRLHVTLMWKAIGAGLRPPSADACCPGLAV